MDRMARRGVIRGVKREREDGHGKKRWVFSQAQLTKFRLLRHAIPAS
jgi:hypothetical protein